jgi:hypothetical protein
LTDYCLAWTTYKKFDKKIEELNKKVKELEQKPEFKSFSCLDIFCLKYWSNVPLRPDLRINARCKNCIE